MLTDEWLSFNVCVIFFWLIFIIKVFIIKVTVKENSFAWNPQRDEFLQGWKLRIYVLNLCKISITSARNEIKWVELLHLLISFCLTFLGAPQWSIFCSLFLIYIKSNRLVSTVKQFVADDVLLFITMLKIYLAN